MNEILGPLLRKAEVLQGETMIYAKKCLNWCSFKISKLRGHRLPDIVAPA